MIKNKNTQKNYNNNCKVYQLVFPIVIGVLITEDDSVRLLSQIMEDLNYTMIMKSNHPKQIKDLGRQVRNFDEDI